MYVSMVALRQSGKRIDSPRQAPIEGELEIRPHNTGLLAQVRTPLTMSAPPIAEIYDVRVLGLIGQEIRLRGFEPCNGAAVLQEWVCQLMGAPFGLDSHGQRRAES